MIIYFEFEGKSGGALYTWENVYVVLAKDGRGAGRRAAELAKAGCYPSVWMIKFRGRWARIVFGGVRKVACCMLPTAAPPVRDASVVDGTEVTHSAFRLSGKAGLRALIAGRPVKLRYEK
ncbi:hypothetical protein [Corallococcus silvisoli]|uniref:hypothetical protein n=1 Tax=Corallococcus silvisoli TaxID=2697031 RepID=UPI0013772911|nr:hypothetical protein [Corallococcus silvisoli]NBD13321.1 hypothetical protein [Corallococcus silvisoli]